MAQSRFTAFLQRVRLLVTGQPVQERRQELGHQFSTDATPTGRLSHEFAVGSIAEVTLDHTFTIPGITLTSGLQHEFIVSSLNKISILTHQFNVDHLDKEKVLGHTFSVPLSATSGLHHEFTGGLAATSGLNHEFTIPSINVTSALTQQFNVNEINTSGVLRHSFGVTQDTSSGLHHQFTLALTVTSGLNHEFTIPGVNVTSGINQQFNVSQIDTTATLRHSFTVTQTVESGLHHNFAVQQTTTATLEHQVNVPFINSGYNLSHVVDLDHIDKEKILSHSFGLENSLEIIIGHSFGVNSAPQFSGLQHEFGIYGIIVDSGLNHQFNINQIDGSIETLAHHFAVQLDTTGQIFHQFTLAYDGSEELSQEFLVSSLNKTTSISHSFQMNANKSVLGHTFSAIGVAQIETTLSHQFNATYTVPSNVLQHQFNLLFTLPLPDPVIHTSEFKFIYDDSNGETNGVFSPVNYSEARAKSYSDVTYSAPTSSGTWYGIGRDQVIQTSLNAAGTALGHRLSNLLDLNELNNLESLGTTFNIRAVNSSPGLQQFALDFPPDSSRRSTMQVILKRPDNVLVSLTLRDDAPNEAFTFGGINQAITNFHTGTITLGFDIGDNPGDGFRDIFPPWTEALRFAEDINSVSTAANTIFDFPSVVGSITAGLRGRPQPLSTLHAFYHSISSVVNDDIVIPTKASGLSEGDYFHGTFMFHNDTLVYPSGTLRTIPEYQSDTIFLRQTWNTPVVTSGYSAWWEINDFPIGLPNMTLVPGGELFGPFFGRQLTISGFTSEKFGLFDPALQLTANISLGGGDPFIFNGYDLDGEVKLVLEKEFLISGIYVTKPNGTPGSNLKRGDTTARLGFTYYEQDYQPEELSWKLGVNTPPNVFTDEQVTDQWVLNGLYRDFTVAELNNGDDVRGRIRAFSPKQNTTFNGIYPPDLLAMSSNEAVNLLGGGTLVWPDITDIEDVLDILYSISGVDRGRIPAMITIKYEDTNAQPKVLRLFRQGSNTLEGDVLEVPVSAVHNDQFGTFKVVTEFDQSVTVSGQLGRAAFATYKYEGKNAIPKVIFTDEESD